MLFLVLLGFTDGRLNPALAVTNTLSFTYTNRQDLLANGWDFLARTATGESRDTEATTGMSPPDVSYDQSAHPGVLQISVGAGDMWASANNTTNSLFRDLSSNWVSLQLNLSVAPTMNYQQVHLALYQDDDNYVEIGHGYNSSVGGEGVLFVIENGGVQLGSPRIINRVGIVNTNVYLRLDRDRITDNVTGQYSHDGTNWISLGEISQEFINPRLCIWVGGSDSPNLLNCNLRWLDIITSDTPLTPMLVAEPRHLVFNAVAGTACTNLQQLRIIARRTQSPVSWTLTPSASWLSAGLTSSTTPDASTVGVDTTGLSPGVYHASLSCDGANAVSAVSDVTLIVNPASGVRASIWHGGRKGAMSVSVDDSQQSGYEKLSACGLKGTYMLWGLTPYAPFTSFYEAGMELGAHTVDHPCFGVNEPTRRYELEANIAGIVAEAGVPEAEVISFAWPCGVTTIEDRVVAADYFLSARGYNLNELEDSSPSDWMNLKSFNSHENDPHAFNPSAPSNPADLKTMVDAAEAQGKWFNLVLHTLNNDDNAIAHSLEKDVWFAPVGSVAKYIAQRDRTVFQNYAETTTNLGFDCYRLPLDDSRLRSFETAIHSNDKVTVELDVTSFPSLGGLTVAGVETPYHVRDVAARRLLFFDSTITTNLSAVTLVIGDGSPVAVDQRITLAEDTTTNLLLVGTALAGDTLSYAIISSPTNGTLSDTLPTLTYAPATNFHGVDAFSFRVTDTTTSLDATGMVRLAVSSVNDSPVVVNPLPDQNGTYGIPFHAYATNVFQDVDGDPLTYSATEMPPGVSINVVGTITGTPTQAGSFEVRLIVRDDWIPSLFATNTFSFVIARSNAPVILGDLDQVYSGGACMVSATTVPPGLTVDLTYDGSPDAPTNAGTYEVIGTVVEVNYSGSATNTLTVAKSNAPINLEGLNQEYSGTARPVMVMTEPAGLTVNLTYDGIPDAPTNAGSYEVIGAVNEVNHAGVATNTLTILKSNVLISLSDLNQWYNGTPRTVTATTEPPELAVNLTYDGSPNAPIVAGNYEVIGTVEEVNYAGSATNTLIVTEVPLVILGVGVTPEKEVTVSWRSISNFTYQLQYKDSLEDEDWQGLLPAVTATGEAATATNSVGDLEHRFYRILLLP